MAGALPMASGVQWQAAMQPAGVLMRPRQQLLAGEMLQKTLPRESRRALCRLLRPHANTRAARQQRMFTHSATSLGTREHLGSARRAGVQQLRQAALQQRPRSSAVHRRRVVSSAEAGIGTETAPVTKPAEGSVDPAGGNGAELPTGGRFPAL